MKMMDTRAYVGMLKELVEQGREVEDYNKSTKRKR